MRFPWRSKPDLQSADCSMTVWENVRNVLIPCCLHPWPDPPPTNQHNSPVVLKGLFNMQKMRARAFCVDTKSEVRSSVTEPVFILSAKQKAGSGKVKPQAWHIWAYKTLSHSATHSINKWPQQWIFSNTKAKSDVVLGRLLVISATGYILSCFHIFLLMGTIL